MLLVMLKQTFCGMSSNHPQHLKRHPGSAHIRKRHYLLGSTVIIVGCWITHTTTATVNSEYSQQRARDAETLFAQSYIFNNDLKDELFIPSLKKAKGPISYRPSPAQSPAQSVFLPIEPPSKAPLTDSELKKTFYQVQRGDTLGSIFKQLKLSSSLLFDISQHKTARRLTTLSIGKNLLFRADEQQGLKQLVYPANPLQNLVIHVDGNRVTRAGLEDIPYQTTQHVISGEINSSFYETAVNEGLSNGLVMEMVQIFGWDIDFILDIRSGDSFHLIYSRYELDGEKLADGHILAAEFITQNQSYRAVRFDDGTGQTSYYTPQGDSMLGTFLRSPVEFSRVSSGFGKRKHPILKIWKAHKGVDYASARGTPIRTTADGRVVHAGKKGGYGKTIVIRHAGQISTLYGHMNGYAKGIRSGSRVKQGDVIGYVGSTGRATGAHLHYEFRVNGVHRDPLSYKTPKAGAVSHDARPAFNQHSSQWMAKLNSISSNYLLAKANRLAKENGDNAANAKTF